MAKPKKHYILEFSLTLLNEDERGIISGKSKLAQSCSTITKEESAKFIEYIIENELSELHKTKVKINYDT